MRKLKWRHRIIHGTVRYDAQHHHQHTHTYYMPSNFGWFIIKILYTQHVDITLILIQMWLCVAFTELIVNQTKPKHMQAQTYILCRSSYIDKHNWQHREKEKKKHPPRRVRDSPIILVSFCYAWCSRVRVCIRRVWKSHRFTLWMCESEKMNETYLCAIWTVVRWMDIWSRLRIRDWPCVCVSARGRKICAWNMLSWGEFNHIFFLFGICREFTNSFCQRAVCCVCVSVYACRARNTA